jgi:hypothetical protein
VGLHNHDTPPAITGRGLANLCPNVGSPQCPFNLHTWDWSTAHDSHYSMLADNDNWALVSMYACNNAPGPYPLWEEIFQITTSQGGTRLYRRIAHTRSDFNLSFGCSDDVNYYSQPRAAISRDGRFIIWSAFVSSAVPARRDVYMAIIPPAP